MNHLECHKDHCSRGSAEHGGIIECVLFAFRVVHGAERHDHWGSFVALKYKISYPFPEKVMVMPAVYEIVMNAWSCKGWHRFVAE